MQKAIQLAYDDHFALACRLAAESGFRHISVNFNEVPDKNDDEWKYATEDIQKILSNNGLECIQTHLRYHNMLESSEIVDEKTDFHIRQAIIAGGALGAKYNVFHPRSSISTGYRVSKSFEDNRALLTDFIEYAIKSNTAIAVENLPIFRTNFRSMPFYSSAFEDLATLVDYFNDEHIVICWDFGHANMLKWEQSEAINFLGSRIKCTHIHNNYGFYDDHSTPDMGNINWQDAMSALAATEFDGPLTLETHCSYADDELFQSLLNHNYACLKYLERLMMNKNDLTKT